MRAAIALVVCAALGAVAVLVFAPVTLTAGDLCVSQALKGGGSTTKCADGRQCAARRLPGGDMIESACSDGTRGITRLVDEVMVTEIRDRDGRLLEVCMGKPADLEATCVSAR